jgi:hypothetical protein
MSLFNKKYKISFTFQIHTHQWQVDLIPSINIYFETHSPIQHKRFWMDGISGLYLSAQWFTKIIIFGIYKKPL